MATRPEHIRELAVALHNGAQEHCRRSAVSRAYYACFHKAAELIKGVGRGANSHENLWWALEQLGKQRHPDYLFRHAAKTGRKLKERRVVAEYDIQSTLAVNETLDSMALAERLWNSLDALPKR